MENYQKRYLSAWIGVVIVFIAVALLVPQQIGDWSKNEGSFWAAFVMILLVFAGQLACSFLVIKKGNAEQQFLRLPITYISFAALFITLVVEIICVIIPTTKNWLGFILGLIILACYGVAVLKAVTAAELIQQTGQKIKEETLFIRSLCVEAELLQKQSGNPAIMTETKRVYEAVRYSDPRGNQALEELEGRLYVAFTAFSKAVKEGNETLCKDEAEKFLLLLDERNKKCRLLK